MNHSIHAHAYLYHRVESDSGTFFSMFVISIICHVVFLAAFILLPGQASSKSKLPRIINVNLVTLPPSRAVPVPSKEVVAKAEKQQIQPIEKEIPPQRKVSPAPEPTDVVSVAPKPQKTKTSLKKKTYQRARVVKPAIKRIEKKVEEERPKEIADAIDRLKNKVIQSEAQQRRQKIETSETEITHTGPGGQTEADSREAAGIIQIYKVEIAYRVQKNWAYPDQLAGGQSNLKALLVFKVMPGGEIKDIFFTDRSGDSYLDESAYKAIVKSNPVLPHPKGVVKPFVLVGLRFTPEGVK